MSISGVERPMFSRLTYSTAKTAAPPKNANKLLLQKDSASNASNSEAPASLVNSTSASGTQSAPVSALRPDEQDIDYAKSKGPLGLTYNRYQWVADELSEYENALLTGNHLDSMKTLRDSMATASSTNPTVVTNANVKLDPTAPEVILDMTPIPQHVDTPQECLDFITQSGTSFASGWINMLRQSSPRLLSDVQNKTNQTMGDDYNWLDISSKALGLDNVGTNTDDVVSKINQAIATLNGYCDAISSVLQKVPVTTGITPWFCVTSLPNIGFFT